MKNTLKKLLPVLILSLLILSCAPEGTSDFTPIDFSLAVTSSNTSARDEEVLDLTWTLNMGDLVVKDDFLDFDFTEDDPQEFDLEFYYIHPDGNDVTLHFIQLPMVNGQRNYTGSETPVIDFYPTNIPENYTEINGIDVGDQLVIYVKLTMRSNGTLIETKTFTLTRSS